MKVEINNRLYNEFVSWAQANNMNDDDIQKYIEKAFRDKFTIDKYGDLNEKLTKEKPKRTKKKVEPTSSEPINKPKNELNHEPNEGVSEEVNEDVNGDVNEDIKTKRKTKVIASR